MIELHATIEINRPRSDVWEVLTDFESYDQWNPYMTIPRGEAHEEAAVEVHIYPSLRDDRTEMGKITALEPGDMLRWESIAIFSWIHASTHTFQLTRVDNDRTRFDNRKQYRGILTPFVADEDTENDLEAMNEALAEFVESQFPPRSV